jgi:thiamine biosynthesis lipoprotein
MKTQYSLMLVLLMASAAQVLAQDLVTFGGATMGTRYAVTIVERADVAELQEKVDARLKEINALMSTYDSESELSRFNQHQGDDWFAVSVETALVVKFALEVAESTGGAFDPTVGPLVNLWGFGPEGRRTRPPSNDEIAATRKKIGYHAVEVREQPPGLRKKRPDVHLDLSAVAKGFAVDEISELLANAGYKDSLVAIAGDIYARGRKPDGTPWQIGIEAPDAPDKAPERKLRLSDAAVSTSGDWRNSFLYDGVRYSHVIDPRTGWPVRQLLASVTVVADRSMQADAWDTALLVLGIERGLEWCERNKVAAIFFVRQADGQVTARASTFLAKRVVPE